VNTNIEVLGHRVHLRRRGALRLFPSGYAVTRLARMAHQGHFWITLRYGFTQVGGNNSAKASILRLLIRYGAVRRCTYGTASRGAPAPARRNRRAGRRRGHPGPGYHNSM
jgi:hypothetical protein